MISAIIVEDEVLAAERLRVLLADCRVVLLHTFHHAEEALSWLGSHETDLVFVDIGLPEVSGLELVARIRRSAKKQPHIIFTTAYEEHALQAFELAATDYLLKPIKLARLQAALARVNEHADQNEGEFTHFKVSSRERMLEIPWQQARYLLAEQKSVFLFTGDGKIHELAKTLIYWEERLADKVIRIHRNALVFRHALDCLIREGNDDDTGSWFAKILDIDEKLPVSRRQVSAIRKVLRQES